MERGIMVMAVISAWLPRRSLPDFRIIAFSTRQGPLSTGTMPRTPKFRIAELRSRSTHLFKAH
jgi:hypothetical protein